MKCPYCKRSNVVKAGVRKNKTVRKQMYWCNSCKMAFSRLKLDGSKLDISDNQRKYNNRDETDYNKTNQKIIVEDVNSDVSFIGYYMMLLGAFIYLALLVAIYGYSYGSDLDDIRMIGMLSFVQGIGIFIFLLGSALSVKSLLDK